MGAVLFIGFSSPGAITPEPRQVGEGAAMPSDPILVVEDDPAIRHLLEVTLRAAGYEPALAADGLEALAQLGRVSPALILLDLNMPRMDGYALAEELRRRRLSPGVPVIVTTAVD